MRVKNDYPNYKKIYITETVSDTKMSLDNTVYDDGIDYVKQHLSFIRRDCGWQMLKYYSFGHLWTFSHGQMVMKTLYGLFYVDFDTQERYLRNQHIGIRK
ncbi:MAG: hypothetical protein ACLS36_07315 [Streptococcus sp.]